MHRPHAQGTDESKIIALATQGDREAFGELYERYVSRVYRHVYYISGDCAVAEDVTAQTFLRALEAIHRFQDRGVPFVAWLLRIAHNLSLNYKKRLQNGARLALPESLEAEGRLYSPEASLDAKADGESVWEAVRQLPHDQRSVIVMRFVDGLGYEEVAPLLGKGIGSVRVIQHRALVALRRQLAETEARPVQAAVDMELTAA